jgi:uncharacterized protein
VKVDLSRIENEPLHFAERLELSPEAVDPALLTAPARVSLDGEVRQVDAGLRAEGRLLIAATVTCGRCLEPVEWQAEETFAVDLVTEVGDPAPDEEGEGDEDEREVMLVVAHTLDLAELAAEQVLLALPIRVLCRDDCAGLCPDCGGNRNLQGGCRCPEHVDPRWNALRGLVVAPGSRGEPE